MLSGQTLIISLFSQKKIAAGENASVRTVLSDSSMAIIFRAHSSQFH